MCPQARQLGGLRHARRLDDRLGRICVQCRQGDRQRRDPRRQDRGDPPRVDSRRGHPRRGDQSQRQGYHLFKLVGEGHPRLECRAGGASRNLEGTLWSRRDPRLQPRRQDSRIGGRHHCPALGRQHGAVRRSSRATRISRAGSAFSGDGKVVASGGFDELPEPGTPRPASCSGPSSTTIRCSPWQSAPTARPSPPRAADGAADSTARRPPKSRSGTWPPRNRSPHSRDSPTRSSPWSSRPTASP